jgi:4-hydroxy-tetrahydrodipicolinate synthase
MAGVGALRTDAAVALARDAKTAGAGAGLLAPVSYTPLTDEEVFVHFQTVAGESELPLCIYNNPGTTHFTFSFDLEQRLSGVAGVVAVKNGSPASGVAAQLADLRSRMPEGFSLGWSGDAWHSVVGGLFPRAALALCRIAQAGDADEARRLNARLAPLWALFTEYGGLRVVYAAGTALGLVSTAPPRPILPLSLDAQTRVEAVVRDLELA